MQYYRNAPTRRLLAHRLAQLRSTLESLGSQVRNAVSQAVGETVGVVVRDALNNALERIAGCGTEPEPPPRPRGWHDEDDEDEWPQDGWGEEPDFDDPPVPDDGRSHRLVFSVSAGLTAAAWWLGRWTGRFAPVRTAIVGVLAGLTAYSAPALAATGLSLLNASGQVAFLSDTAQAFATP